MAYADAIKRVAPAAEPYARELIRQMAEAGVLANPRRAAAFLGQIHVESAGFRRVTESLGYRAERLLAVFRSRNGLRTLEQAQALVVRGHEAIANHVYGGEWGAANLGNTDPGDGWRYRGRGLKQLTGKDNYRRFSLAWQGDLSVLMEPDQVAEPAGAVASAVWFWASRRPKGIETMADAGDIAGVTKLVNGGQMALADRAAWTREYHAALVAAADFSNVIGRVTSTEQMR